jgi:hypothetical protein
VVSLLTYSMRLVLFGQHVCGIVSDRQPHQLGGDDYRYSPHGSASARFKERCPLHVDEQ